MPSEPGIGWVTAWHALFAAALLFTAAVQFGEHPAPGTGIFVFLCLIVGTAMLVFHRWMIGHYLAQHPGLRPLPVGEQLLLCALVVLALVLLRPLGLKASTVMLPVLFLTEWRLWMHAKACRKRQFLALARPRLRQLRLQMSSA